MNLDYDQPGAFILDQAIVNEDASGDLIGLHQEIQELKVDRLESHPYDILLKKHYCSKHVEIFSDLIIESVCICCYVYFFYLQWSKLTRCIRF